MFFLYLYETPLIDNREKFFRKLDKSQDGFQVCDHNFNMFPLLKRVSVTNYEQVLMHDSINYLNIYLLLSFSIFYCFAHVYRSFAKVITSFQVGREDEVPFTSQGYRRGNWLREAAIFFCRTSKRFWLFLTNQDVGRVLKISPISPELFPQFWVQINPGSVNCFFGEPGTNRWPNREVWFWDWCLP